MKHENYDETEQRGAEVGDTMSQLSAGQFFHSKKQYGKSNEGESFVKQYATTTTEINDTPLNP
jgi:hypothetical protein